jgi:hypothetical protein
MTILKYVLAGFAAGITLSADACTILEFGAENLLLPDQNTLEINFQEVKAFAASQFPTKPIFTGSDPRFETNLNAPIDLTGFGYAVVHYAPGTSGNPAFNQGGCLDFYFISDASSCPFTFPQTGPGGRFSNGPITSVTLFTSELIPDTGTSVMLFAIALCGLSMVHCFVKQ